MKYIFIIAFTCAGIPSLAFLLFAPPAWQQFTLCIYGILCTFIVAMLGIVVGGAAKEDPE